MPAHEWSDQRDPSVADRAGQGHEGPAEHVAAHGRPHQGHLHQPVARQEPLLAVQVGVQGLAFHEESHRRVRRHDVAHPAAGYVEFGVDHSFQRVAAGPLQSHLLLDGRHASHGPQNRPAAGPNDHRDTRDHIPEARQHRLLPHRRGLHPWPLHRRSSLAHWRGGRRARVGHRHSGGRNSCGRTAEGVAAAVASDLRESRGGAVHLGALCGGLPATSGRHLRVSGVHYLLQRSHVRVPGHFEDGRPLQQMGFDGHSHSHADRLLDIERYIVLTVGIL
mmetsp:Transcript_10134/g.15153  ORF Transcript_10134/g.15153 Transcript_10134/m.15153 type:complete len:277 (-) Transcript_10134:78-908(-)